MILPYQRIHFVGVSGVGMIALAQVLLEAGHQVSGSDIQISRAAQRLRQAGAVVHQGHAAEQVNGTDLVVASSAIPPDNAELRRAHGLGLPVWKRAELLGELTRFRRSIAVAGTHGKTTTSAMISFILEQAGLSPTILVGGELRNLGTGAKLGSGPYLVAEADEFDGSFLHLSPWMAVVTSLEADHLDYYGSLEALTDAFRRFVGLVPEDGVVLLCGDAPGPMSLRSSCRARSLTYGLVTEADWRAHNLSPNQLGGSDFRASHQEKPVGKFRLQVPGRHNVVNALAALAVAAELGVDPAVSKTALCRFQGTGRRFEHLGTVGGVKVYDDYAHHPTEIRATLAAAREHHQGRLWVVFQPHTASRTKSLFGEFASAFDLADRVVITDIYHPAGREAGAGDVTSGALVRAMSHPDVTYIPELEETTRFVAQAIQPGDLVITMGAGDIHKVAEALLRSEVNDDNP